jgi:cation:H+ antiporter
VGFLAILGLNIRSFWGSRRRIVARGIRDGTPRVLYHSRMLAIIALILGFVILTTSARWFVDGAIAIGRRYHLSELFVGIAIIAVGTSLPELAVNISASARGFGELAAANILGSNIANLLLIIGVAALVRPIAADPKRIRSGLPITILATLLVVVLARNSFLTSSLSASLGWVGGVLLIASFAAFAFFTYRKERLPAPSEPEVASSKTRAFGAVVLGAAGLAVSANVIVNAAIALAGFLGISQTLVGETLIALGTSLPELAAGITAARRGANDLIIGNVVGSNVFNLLVVLGVSALIAPIPFSGRAMADALIAGAVAALLWVALAFHRRLHGVIHPHYVIGRSYGVVLVLLYAAYIAFAAWQG